MGADPRLPVVIVDVVPDVVPAGLLVLAEGAHPLANGVFTPAPRHGLACRCCPVRRPAAQALDRLHRSALAGPVPRGVLALVRSAAGRAELEWVLAEDVLSRARFRSMGG